MDSNIHFHIFNSDIMSSNFLRGILHLTGYIFLNLVMIASQHLAYLGNDIRNIFLIMPILFCFPNAVHLHANSFFLHERLFYVIIKTIIFSSCKTAINISVNDKDK